MANKKVKDTNDEIKKEAISNQKKTKLKKQPDIKVSVEEAKNDDYNLDDKKLKSENLKKINKRDEKSGNIKFITLIFLIVLLAAICIFIFLKNKTNYIKVEDSNALTDILGVEVATPDGGQNVKYGIENDSIAKIDYIKTYQGGEKLPFTLRSSTNMEDDLVQLDYEFGTPIVMESICNDGKKVSVLAQVALTDEPSIMKAEWMDNNNYYAMVTTKLTTREDFLQEVNKVIINTHIDDYTYSREDETIYEEENEEDYDETQIDVGTPSNVEVETYEEEPEE